MRIPGFSAEASLYKTSGHYRVAGARKGLTYGWEVLPQLQNLSWGTTRDVCTACGCKLSFFNCDCGNSSSKLDCIRNGGPAQGVFGNVMLR